MPIKQLFIFQVYILTMLK